MDIVFLGTGSAFNPAMGNSNAYFFLGERLYLLDCGESAFGKLWDSPAYLRCSSVSVVLTHLHADHVGSLGSLISYGHLVSGKRVEVVHPLETAVHHLDLVGIDRGFYDFRKLGLDGFSALPGGLRLRPLAVEHVPSMTCFGYILDDGSEKAYFSGDAARVPEEVLAGLRSGEIARAYQDTCSLPSDHPTHASLEYLTKAVPPELRSRVLCMHLDRDCGGELRRLGFGVAEAGI